MITSRIWYTILINGLLFANTALQPAWGAVSEALSPASIAPGERATLTVRLDYTDLQGIDPNDEQSVPELFDEPLNKADGLILLDKNYERTRTQFVWSYSFTAYVPQTYRVPAVEIRFGAQTFSTTASTLTVVSGRDTNDEELRPEFGKASVPTEIPWKLWAALGLLLFLVGLFFFARRTLGKKAVGSATDFDTPEAWLKQALERYLKEHASSSPPVAAESFSALLKEYLRRRYVTTTPTMTLRELLAAVRTWEKTDTEKTKTLEQLIGDIESILFQKNATIRPHIAENAVRTTQLLFSPAEDQP